MSSFKRVWTDMRIYINIIYIYIYISQLLESKKWETCLILVLTCFFSNSWNPKNGKKWLVLVLTSFSQTPGVQKMGKMISFGVDMFFSQTFGVDMFFSNSCKSKNGENWLVLVLTDWNLEPSAYTRIEGKIWKCKVAPKNNVFFQKGLNRHAYIHIIYIYIYFSTPGIQQIGKLPNFGDDMFFSNSWNPKNGKFTSFGVDMFFSNSWSPKNWENWLVLVLLTCFSLKLLVLTCFSQTRASQKMGNID